MNATIVLSRSALDIVLSNLVCLEERREELLQEYFPAPSRERSEAIELIDGYVARLERILASVAVCDRGRAEFPFAVIGSRVTVQACASNTLSTLRLVGPLHDLVDFADISFLSPMGRALLLRRCGDRFTLTAAGGACDYLVRSVTLA